MKQFKIILCFLLLSTALSIPASAKDHNAPADSSRVTTPDNHIIPNERIGAIRLGMGMDEVQDMLGKPSNWQYRPGGSKAFTNAISWSYVDLNLLIYFDSGPAPVVTGIRATVWPSKSKTIHTLYWKDELPVKVIFQTTQGITLGSSAFDVKRAYSNYKYVDQDSEGVVMNYKSLGLIFWTTMDHVVSGIEISRPQ